MKYRSLWVFAPVFLGLLIAVCAVVLPARAGNLAQTNGPTGDDPVPGSSVVGVVESFPELLVGEWTVSGVVYTATADTEFSSSGGPFYIGACVKVKYDPDTNTAYEIEMEAAEKCSGDDHARKQFTGLIEQVPAAYSDTITSSPGVSGTWVISGTEFVSTEETRLKTHNGPLEVGACARVKYREVNGVNIADEIRNEKIYRCYTPTFFNQAYGYLDTFPEDLSGAWVISDSAGMSLTFMTTPSTHFHIKHEPLEFGACIRVKYFYDQGIYYGADVRTMKAQQCEGRFIDLQPLSKIYATIDSMPPGGTMTGTWMLAGVSFTVTEQTKIEEEEGLLSVESCAEAKYDPANGAMSVRKLEGEEASDCQDDDGLPRFKLFGVVEMMPTGGYTGTWQVSGVSFSVNPSTTVESRHGDFAIGAYVKVYFTFDAASGERVAQAVKTHVAPGYGRMNYRGRYDGWNFSPSGDQIILDGNPLSADADIDVPDNLQAGDMVWVNLYQSGGILYVTQVSADYSINLPMIQR